MWTNEKKIECYSTSVRWFIIILRFYNGLQMWSKVHFSPICYDWKESAHMDCKLNVYVDSVTLFKMHVHHEKLRLTDHMIWTTAILSNIALKIDFGKHTHTTFMYLLLFIYSFIYFCWLVFMARDGPLCIIYVLAMTSM